MGNNEAAGFAGCFQALPYSRTFTPRSTWLLPAGTGGPLVGGKGFFNTVGTVTNGYYNSDKLKPDTEVVSVAATAKTAAEMKTAGFASLLGNAWKADTGSDGRIINNGYPYLVNAAPCGRYACGRAVERTDTDCKLGCQDIPVYKVCGTVHREGRRRKYYGRTGDAGGAGRRANDVCGTELYGNIHQSHQR